MSTSKPTRTRHTFARGNKAASKGEPRTVAFSCRLPERTAEKLAALAYGRGTRTDALIELIEEAVPDWASPPYHGRRTSAGRHPTCATL